MGSQTVVVGAQWGDEGKGKIVDYLASKADVVVRFNGGGNAGHTVCHSGQTFRFHYLPSGVIQGKLCILGTGMVIDPPELLAEIGQFKAAGFAPRLRISARAQVIFPHHKRIDARTGGHIGTTGRGIGPAYAARARRTNLRMGDLVMDDVPQRLQQMLEVELPLLEAAGIYSSEELESYSQELIATYADLKEKLTPLVMDTECLLHDLMKKNVEVLFEGAQGILLDINYGTYPFVTSCTTGAGGVYAGGGAIPGAPLRVIGISKAYTTRVGAGPFPTELHGTIAEELRERGQEYGTTTGRPRRVGWLDLFALRYAVQVSGIQELVITKIDTLSEVEPLKVAVGYHRLDCELSSFPTTVNELAEVEPVLLDCDPLEKLTPDEWQVLQSKPLDQFPAGIRNYLKLIEEYCDCPVTILSYGPDREATLVF